MNDKLSSRARRTASCLAIGCVLATGCGTERGVPRLGPNAFSASLPLQPERSALRIHELVAANEGVAVDELGETDDYVELENSGNVATSLAGYTLTDSAGNRAALPNVELAPGAVVLLWADGETAQGSHHLPLKLDADGEQLTLWADPYAPVDRAVMPALEPNETLVRASPEGFVRCRYASPGTRSAGCVAPPPPLPREKVTFAPYFFPEPFPSAPSPLAINELALRPASFVEVVNTSTAAVDLNQFALRIFAITPSQPAPRAAQGSLLAWPRSALAPGERIAVPVDPAALATLFAEREFEGRVALFDAEEKVVDRVPFMAWPEGAALARVPDTHGAFRFCTAPTADATNLCTPVATRLLGDRAHAFETPADFAALAEGGTESGQAAVKFIVDMQANDMVHLLQSRRWDLHYRFVREHVYQERPLNRCDQVEATLFDLGWREFSNREYYQVANRRFLLGTFVQHASGLSTIEFASGDTADASMIARAYRAAVAATYDPRAWSLRPSDDHQIAEMRKLEGNLPIVGPDAPFVNLTYQPLTEGHSYGTLRFVPAAELATTPLPPETLLITDDVPNDVPFVGGIITEAFQTPLSHVNVLSQARGTPNMALRGARDNERLKALANKLVRLDVGPSDFSIREATLEEADAFWAERRPRGPRIAPPGDTSVRNVQPLAAHTLAALPFVGAKAAQFAELYRVNRGGCGADATFEVPKDAFALPVAHYLDHFIASGAAERLRVAREDPSFRADSAVRAAALEQVRAAILEHPVERTLLDEVTSAVRTRFGNRRVRFRSSSNVEDLPTFNGAGLHTSTSVELDDPERTVALGLRTVWASLWSQRAYDERESANLDQNAVLMGVLVHEAQRGEAAQGVGISRDLLDLTRNDVHYINAQIGEASVTNPAPGVSTEQLLYAWWYQPPLSYRSWSSLTSGAPVLTLTDARLVSCALSAIHEHFRPLLDPQLQNRAFAMQIEFKFERDRTLVVKQARPQPFGHVTLPADCR